MIVASGVRIGWSDLPDPVRAAVEDVLGDRVVQAVSQPGGFSPGTADRVLTSGGRRAFVKAVSPAQNDRSPDLHRREISTTALLPPEAPVPRLLGSYDDGDWVALILEDVDGRQPATPWRADELAAVLAAAHDLAARLTPSPVAELPSAAEALAEDLAGWSRLRADPPDDLDPWAREHLDQLCELADAGIRALDGDTLAHCDVRADNLLLRDDGSVVFVDWPWASIGPPWLDTLLLLINVALYGGHDPDDLLEQHCADVDPAALDAALAGIAGYFVDVARRPPAPGLPTVRAFQRAQGISTSAWVKVRLGRAALR